MIVVASTDQPAPVSHKQQNHDDGRPALWSEEWDFDLSHYRSNYIMKFTQPALYLTPASIPHWLQTLVSDSPLRVHSTENTCMYRRSRITGRYLKTTAYRNKFNVANFMITSYPDNHHPIGMVEKSYRSRWSSFWYNTLIHTHTDTTPTFNLTQRMV